MIFKSSFAFSVRSFLPKSFLFYYSIDYKDKVKKINSSSKMDTEIIKSFSLVFSLWNKIPAFELLNVLKTKK